MAQITHGVRVILSHPFIYSSLQSFMGAHKARQSFVVNFVRPFSGMKVLDMGCGPADILAYLPDVEYWGFDISENYISQARKRFGKRGEFHPKQLQMTDLERLPSFDMVLAIGLLHHLDDAVATDVMRLAYRALKPGGRLLTIDPCFDPGQNQIARFLIGKDRGQNVRTREGYASIASQIFEALRIEVQHKAWIPYTHCLMECTRI